jgi:hypothetical protein
MKMTRQHFEFLARFVAEEEDSDQRAKLARRMARELRYTNPRFDDDRFIKACGVDPRER